MTRKTPILALHGGAGAHPTKPYAVELEHMRGQVEQARDWLLAGHSALDVATQTVAAMEISGLYIAGKGASQNRDGEYELDASVMDGVTGRAGAVAALQDFASPIAVARAVMERTPHVMLVGAGAARFAREIGMIPIADAKTWFTPAGQDEANHSPGSRLGAGTVGCVVRDVHGALAAATSTGGVFGKLPGRCGDSPVIGAGAWADERVAVSCTGEGEYFIRIAAAAQIAHRVRWGGQTLNAAARETIEQVARLGGHGGLIAVGADGDLTMPFRSSGMKRAALRRDGSISCQVR